MIKKSRTLIVLLLLLPISFLSCDPYDRVDLSGVANEGYDGFKSDAELFLEFAYRKQSIVMNFLNYTSDGFKKEPLKGVVTKDEFEKFFFEIEEFNKNAPKYEQAITRIQYSNVLLDPTRARTTNAITDFFIWASGIGKRQRERAIIVASNLSAKERTKLYNGLLPELKNKAKNETDFWNKLQKGELDTSAPRIYEGFYHNGETEFYEVAHEKGLTIGKIVVEEGTEGLEHGSAVIIDTASDLIPGFSVGTTIVTVADNTEKMVKSKTWSEAAKHGLNSVGEVMGEFGGEIGTAKKIGETIKNITEIYDHAEPKITSGEENKGKVNIKDKNTKEPAKIVIATRTDITSVDDNRSSVYVSVKNKVSKGIDLIMKAGSWIITTVSENGKRETTLVEVKKGESIGVTINTGEPKVEEATDGEISLTFIAILKAHYNSPTDTEVISFNIPQDTKFRGKGKIYTGSSYEEKETVAGMYYVSDYDYELEFDKVKNPKKIKSLKGEGTVHIYYEGQLTSIARVNWELVDLTIGAYETPNVIHANEVCKHIKELNGFTEDLVYQNHIILEDYSCDSESQMWLTVKNL